MPVFARACGEGCKDKPPPWIYTKGTRDCREEVKPSLRGTGFRGLWKQYKRRQYYLYGKRRIPSLGERGFRSYATNTRVDSTICTATRELGSRWAKSVRSLHKAIKKPAENQQVFIFVIPYTVRPRSCGSMPGAVWLRPFWPQLRLLFCSRGSPEPLRERVRRGQRRYSRPIQR